MPFVMNEEQIKNFVEPEQILEDIMNGSKKAKYPLWVDDYLVVQPHKRKGTIEFNTQDGYGHYIHGDECAYTDNIEIISNTMRSVIQKTWEDKE